VARVFAFAAAPHAIEVSSATDVSSVYGVPAVALRPCCCLVVGVPVVAGALEVVCVPNVINIPFANAFSTDSGVPAVFGVP
jgi:hypothetical protein